MSIELDSSKFTMYFSKKEGWGEIFLGYVRGKKDDWDFLVIRQNLGG